MSLKLENVSGDWLLPQIIMRKSDAVYPLSVLSITCLITIKWPNFTPLPGSPWDPASPFSPLKNYIPYIHNWNRT